MVSDPFEHMSMKTAFKIVIGVLVIMMVSVGLLSYEMGEHKGMKKMCEEGVLVYDFSGKVVCQENTTIQKFYFKEVK